METQIHLFTSLFYGLVGELKTNEEILETIGEERSLIRTIKTRQKRRITVKNGNRRENARKRIKRKTKTNDAGLDDGGRI